MTTLAELESYLNNLLSIHTIKDYCPNGLQIDGSSEGAYNKEVNTIVTGVSANAELIDYAISINADALIVHHGFFWKGEPQPLTGLKGRRIQKLISSGISLLAYHLPLDIHPELGNNILLSKKLELNLKGTFCKNGPIDLGVYGDLSNPTTPQELTHKLSELLNRTPQHISVNDKPITKIGICTGAAQDFLEEAADLGLDAFISGEISERTPHIAKELGIDYISAGHHATETFGVEAISTHIEQNLGVKSFFSNIQNPV